MMKLNKSSKTFLVEINGYNEHIQTTYYESLF